MKTFFPNFEEVYGHHDKLKIILQSNSAPQLMIRDGLSSMECSGRLRFLNPFNDEYEAVSIAV